MSAVFFLSAGTGSEGHHTLKTCHIDWTSCWFHWKLLLWRCRIVSRVVPPDHSWMLASSGAQVTPHQLHSVHLSQVTRVKCHSQFTRNDYFTAHGDKLFPRAEKSSRPDFYADTCSMCCRQRTVMTSILCALKWLGIKWEMKQNLFGKASVGWYFQLMSYIWSYRFCVLFEPVLLRHWNFFKIVFPEVISFSCPLEKQKQLSVRNYRCSVALGWKCELCTVSALNRLF